MFRILIAEDEEPIANLIRMNLTKAGYLCTWAPDGKSAADLMEREKYDLALLDIMLPGINGYELMDYAKACELPVIFLTALGSTEHKVKGLRMGADDYLPKPFSPKVLIARIRSVLRRVNHLESEAAGTTLKRGPLSMNRGTREALLDGKPLVLTFSEFEILYLLARRPGWVYTRGQIVNEVKGDDYPVTERAIDVQMVSLRRKLGEYGSLIETVRGVGYRFVQE